MVGSRAAAVSGQVRVRPRRSGSPRRSPATEPAPVTDVVARPGKIHGRRHRGTDDRRGRKTPQKVTTGPPRHHDVGELRWLPGPHLADGIG